MNIGQASRASGVSAKMIRYYESIDLMPPASRSDAGYRVYSEHEIHTLQFIKRARDLGFCMKDIKKLVDLWQNQARSSAEVKALALRHIDELQHKIADMQAMAETLTKLATHCHGDHRPHCPILDDLASS